MFSYNSKNTLNRIIFDSNRRRREGVENAAPAPSLVEAKPGKSPAASLLGRKTPSQARSFQSNFCNSVDEVQQQRMNHFSLVPLDLTGMVPPKSEFLSNSIPSISEWRIYARKGINFRVSWL